MCSLLPRHVDPVAIHSDFPETPVDICPKRGAMLTAGDTTVEHICWDDDQIEHLAEHGVSVDEWEYVYDHFLGQDVSESTGRPIRFGYTASGRFVLVIYEVDDVEGVLWISPVTACEVPEPTWRLSDE